MDNKTWKVVIKGWEHPVVNDKDGKATTNLKPEDDWSKEEDKLGLGNSKALNALFNGVNKNIFRHPTQPRANQMASNIRKEWIPKSVNTSLITHTSLRGSAREDWYLDSGCSRHVTGVKKFLENIKSYSTGYVTFKDGAKGEIKGVGRLSSIGLSSLDNVMLVKGMTANLFSISKLCDEGLKVNFTRSECLVTDEKNEVLMRGIKSKDNC
ncbi:uncharacterized protein LOC127136498 [Lathyrus oleraceus]|uniref:uncharacterized protein LOC127136498 n=1 Tax=Pisum sativum TaxID=3888 RepID=UPI0021D07BD9|nr:uncharacterized protein LOC127136498 [Pisum sativum]